MIIKIRSLLFVCSVFFNLGCSLESKLIELGKTLVGSYGVHLTSTVSTNTSASVIPVTVSFPEEVVDFKITNIEVIGASVQNFTGSGRVFKFDLISMADGASVSVRIPADTIEDVKGYLNPSSNNLLFVIDRTAPALTISGPDLSHGNQGTTFTWVLDYSEDSQIHLTSNNIELVGSASSTCGLPTLSIVPQEPFKRRVHVKSCAGNGDLSILVSAETAIDLAGNKALSAGPSLSAVVDNTAPLLEISSVNPASGNSSTVFSWELIYSSADIVTLKKEDVTLIGATAGCEVVIKSFGGVVSRTIEVSGCTGTGSVGVKVDSNTAKDIAGNAALAVEGQSLAQIDSSSFVPVLSSATSNYTTAAVIPVTVNFSQSTSTFSQDDIVLAGATISSFSGSGSSYTFDLIGLLDGQVVTLSIPEGVVFSGSGKGNEASNILRFYIDRTAPTLTISGPTPLKGNSATSVTWVVDYLGADSIELESTDITFVGESANCVAAVKNSAVADQRIVEVTGCTGTGNLQVRILAGTGSDLAGNSVTTVVDGAAVQLNNEPFTLALSSTIDTTTNASSIPVAVQFSSSTTNFSVNDITVSGATVGNFTGSGSSYTFELSLLSETQPVTVSVAQASVIDSFGNQNSPSNVLTFNVDRTPPAISILGPLPSIGDSSAVFEWTVTYAGAESIAAVTNFTGETQGCEISIDDINATTQKVRAKNCTGNGNLNFELAAGSASDAIGNLSLAAFGNSAVVDNEPPTLVIVGPAPEFGNSSKTFKWTLTYDDADEVLLNQTTVGSFIEVRGATEGCVTSVDATSASVRTVNVTGCSGNGDLSLHVNSGSARDSVGNSALGADGDVAKVDNLAPTMAVTGPTPAKGRVTTALTWNVQYEADVSNISLDTSKISLRGTNTTDCSVSEVLHVDDNEYSVVVTGCSAEAGQVGITLSAGTGQDSAGNVTLGNNSSSLASIDNSLNAADPGVANDVLIMTFDTRIVDTGMFSSTTAANQVRLPLQGSGYKFSVSWGDGVTEIIQSAPAIHTYSSPGVYDVKIIGQFPRMSFGGLQGSDKIKIIDLKQWGTGQWTDMSNMFQGCENLQMTAVDAPDLSQVTDMRYMFDGAKIFNGSIGHWDTSKIVDMRYMFRNAAAFNENIQSWKTSKVTSMESMFQGASTFNQPLVTWQVGQVISMKSMFLNATSFAQYLNNWDVRNVTDMSGMFSGAVNFQSDLNWWTTKKVTSMANMFEGAKKFNGDISSWDVSNVELMNAMFLGAELFNRNIGSWNTEKVISFAAMFQNAKVFNQDIRNWKTSKIVAMSSMFSGAESFNQNIGSWNTEAVTNMSGMFRGATAFNQNLNSWKTNNVTNMSGMFQNAVAFNQDLDGWNTEKVVNMSSMFYGATAFNRSLNSWKTGVVKNMSNMFRSTSAFNQNINGWNTEMVEDMSYMFNDAIAFNQSLNSWNVLGVKNFRSMFMGALAFNGEIRSWPVDNATSMRDMFRGAVAFNRRLNWNVYNVIDMQGMFWGATSYNQDIGFWEVFKVSPRPPANFATGATSWVLPKPDWTCSLESPPPGC